MAGARDEAELWTALRETQIKVSAWDDTIGWLTHLRNGNGKPALDTRLNDVEKFVKSRRRMEVFVVCTLVAALITVAVGLTQIVAINGMKATLQQMVIQENSNAQSR